MSRRFVAFCAGALVLLALGLSVCQRSGRRHLAPAAASSPEVSAPPAVAPAPGAGQGFLYGRVTAEDGTVYEGRLRFAGNEEAFWGDTFNGYKIENPWAAEVPPGRLPTEHRPLVILGVVIADRERPIDLHRSFMARFGDLTRIAARGRQVQVKLKSGLVYDYDRFDASDLDDGIRVWDAQRGVVDLDSRQIRTIEFLPTVGLTEGPRRLHGTVRTRQASFAGFVVWNRSASVGSDELHGRAAEADLALPFDTIRSIARGASGGSLVTLADGREMALSGTMEAGDDNRGLYVEDPRYGRVLISWEAFERVDFSGVGNGPADGGADGSGPAYGDFPPGVPIRGSVTTRDGRRLAGRIVYDLDESETTETLDAPIAGVNYDIPFGLVESIVPPRGDEDGAQTAAVTLWSGEVLQLERAGDLGPGNAGMLVFTDGVERPQYVTWAEVARLDLDRPQEMPR